MGSSWWYDNDENKKNYDVKYDDNNIDNNNTYNDNDNDVQILEESSPLGVSC